MCARARESEFPSVSIPQPELTVSTSNAEHALRVRVRRHGQVNNHLLCSQAQERQQVVLPVSPASFASIEKSLTVSVTEAG